MTALAFHALKAITIAVMLHSNLSEDETASNREYQRGTESQGLFSQPHDVYNFRNGYVPVADAVTYLG